MKPILLTALALTVSTALVDSLSTAPAAVAQACGAPACVYDPITHTYIPDPSYASPTITPATPPPPTQTLRRWREYPQRPYPRF